MAMLQKRISMKIIILMVLPFIVFASGEKINIVDHMSLHSSNHKPLQKFQKRKKLHQLHKVDDKDLEKIVKKLTEEKIVYSRLEHVTNYLVYKVETKHYNLIINALDGSVIKQESKEGI